MKQTAVEWLIEEMHKNIDWIPVPMQEQALAIEKEKAIEFAKYCLDKAKDLDIRTAFGNVEEYLETFKQEQ
jgi:hypothetical protein